MNNVSLNGESVKLTVGDEYIVIDALYISDIQQELNDLNKEDLYNEIRNKIFKYTDTPFAVYKATSEDFYLAKMKKIDVDEVEATDVLSTDSAVIIFLNKRIFLDFVVKFDYYELTNDTIGVLNIEYWNSITNTYPFTDIAIIVSPGINSGTEFDGSGTFRIS